MTRLPRHVQSLLLAAFIGATIFAAMFLVSRGTPVGTAPVRAAGDATQTAPRFAPVDIFIDSGAQSLAAYQCAVDITAGDVSIVGIEGGEHAAFKEPPYYDPAALQNHRVIIAAFNTGSDLPKGRTRVARLMVRISGAPAGGKPEYAIKLVVAAGPEGKPISAKAEAIQGDTP